MESDMHLNLFIIEDEEAHFALMKRAISKDLPHSSIRYFANARTCLEELDESEPDIIITDYLMPGMNGLEFLEALNREGRDIPVVMITGQGDERIAVEAMKSGAWDYLVKTADFFTLLPSVIRKVFREKALRNSVKKSERRFQDVAEQTSEWLWEVDAEGTCVYSNPVVEKILGYTPSEIVGKSLWELFPPKEGMSLKDSLSSKTNPESRALFSNTRSSIRRVGKSSSKPTAVPSSTTEGTSLDIVGYIGISPSASVTRRRSNRMRRSSRP
jgi:PAS domain S-box-containing protein